MNAETDRPLLKTVVAGACNATDSSTAYLTVRKGQPIGSAHRAIAEAHNAGPTKWSVSRVSISVQ
jgi:hypothetical protein